MVTMDFSQRMGLTTAVKVAQVEAIDTALHNALWNVLTLNLFAGFYQPEKYYPDVLIGSNFQGFAELVFSEFHKVPVDTIPYKWSEFRKAIRENFFKMKWHRVYSFLEFVVSLNYNGSAQILVEEFNRVLERENSAYRFVSGKVTPITSRDEIEEIEQAISGSDQYAGVRTHLQTSLGMLTDRQNPDYRNSIKESISAVESLAKQLVGVPSATLDGALKVLEKSHKLHPALKKAFSSLYGYTNDSDGIRHALMENSELTKADARFMLICCSAFINFAIDSVED